MDDVQFEVVALLAKSFNGPQNAAEVFGFVTQSGNVEDVLFLFCFGFTQAEHIGIHQIVNHAETVLHAVAFHAMLQIKTDRHDKFSIVGNLDNLFLQSADQNLLVLRLINRPMLGEDIFVAEKFFPQQCDLPKRIGDVQMNQIRLKKVLFDIVEAVLIHPQHFQFAQGIGFRRTDINLHMGMVLPFYLLDLE